MLYIYQKKCNIFIDGFDYDEDDLIAENTATVQSIEKIGGMEKSIKSDAENEKLQMKGSTGCLKL